MSQKLFNLSPDLKRLREEGYYVEKIGGFLVMREVPYVDSQKRVRLGVLISSLCLAGDITTKPDNHQLHFAGDFPCHADGSLIKLGRQACNITVADLIAKHKFSSKPINGYTDYYHKMSTYANLLSGPAATIDPKVTAKVFRSPEPEEESIFQYTETASDRVGIGELSKLLAGDRIAIIGLGGTGGYILDAVAKTPAREIRLFDGDTFLQHNAFRAPGAPSLEEIREVISKVEYFKRIYSRMHKGIVAHNCMMGAEAIHLLDGVTFAFLSMDAGEAKRLVVKKLESIGASFVDVGMGLELVDGSLGGILRTTTSTPKKREHVHSGRISFAGGGEEDIYASNIQVADLNALNAMLAVNKWKRIRGFYRDLECEHHSTYTTDGNMLLNGDQLQ